MATSESDEQLINEFISGNETAFNRLIQKYQQKIYWHARRMTGNHLDADEVVQEVLIVIYKKLKDFKSESSLYTWIYKITSTRSLNLINRRKIKDMFSLDDSENRIDIAGNEDIVTDIENKEKLEKLNSVLQKLPVKQREVFIFRNFDELTYDEISRITGKSAGALKANYFHALNKVMDLMKENKNE
jgi:RNA polymerase sigma-70 factor, ECF subfamily